MNEEEEILDYKGVAFKLDVTSRTIKRYIDDGMPHLKGRGKQGSVRFVWKDVKDWMQNEK
jgi:hypothetical protein